MRWKVRGEKVKKLSAVRRALSNAKKERHESRNSTLAVFDSAAEVCIESHQVANDRLRDTTAQKLVPEEVAPNSVKGLGDVNKNDVLNVLSVSKEELKYEDKHFSAMPPPPSKLLLTENEVVVSTNRKNRISKDEFDNLTRHR